MCTAFAVAVVGKGVGGGGRSRAPLPPNVGQLRVSTDETIVWSAHTGGTSVSGSASERCHMFDGIFWKHKEMIGPCSELDMITPP